ncbi:hypothetical protein ABFS82_01G006900 [Erythranthe guttata]
MAQRIDNLVDDDKLKRFYLQYCFPPSCVGEVGRAEAPSRREIGHGKCLQKELLSRYCRLPLYIKKWLVQV